MAARDQRIDQAARWTTSEREAAVGTTPSKSTFTTANTRNILTLPQFRLTFKEGVVQGRAKRGVVDAGLLPGIFTRIGTLSG